MQSGVNRQIVLVKRPIGMVDEQCFAEVEGEIPTPVEGQTLVRVLCVGIDPAIRGWIELRAVALGREEPVPRLRYELELTDARNWDLEGRPAVRYALTDTGRERAEAMAASG